MRILLTGAAGFTGRHFAEIACAAGHDVIPLLANLTDRETLQEQVQDAAPDAVVHLAAISFVGHADNNAFYAVNVLGTDNLLAALVQLPKTPRVLLASSANIYGNCDQSPITEDQPPAPVNHYAISKLAMEYIARTYADRLDLIVTRPFNYTGPGQHLNFVIPKLVDHFARRAPAIALGNLNVEREFNDVQMVCSVYLQLLQYGERGETYNVCSAQPVALQYVIGELERITGHQIQVQIDARFVRSSEVRRLCGSPSKLKNLLAKHGSVLHDQPLKYTLERMLDASLAKQCSG